jgi:type IV pilus assembly protein PilV
MLNRQFHAQNGVILLEALIAIVIFSFGILGMIAMQAAAIRQSDDVQRRVKAAYLANQIISQAWIDRTNLNDYIYQETGTGVGANGAACVFTGTSPALSANVGVWLGDAAKPDSVLGALPGASAQIKVTPISNLITVTICWKAPAESTTHNFTSTALISG